MKLLLYFMYFVFSFSWRSVVTNTIRFKPDPERNVYEYSIVAHGKIVPNSPYFVTIHVGENLGKSDFFVAITGTTEDDDKVSIVKLASIESIGVEVVQLNVGNVKKGTYKLTVSATGALEFKHEKQLFLESDRLSIFVQTDKAMYKPGQDVKFRAVVIDKNMLPVAEKNVALKIQDAKQNVIQVFEDTSLSNGVVSRQFKLSDQPNLGLWTIEGKIDQQTFSKSFTVAEYVPPFFDVDIVTPPYVTVNTTEFTVTVKATYTYGSAVKGEMIFKVSYNHGSTKRVMYELYTNIKGEITVPLNANNVVSYRRRLSQPSINLDVSVIDSLSGKTVNKSKTITMFKNDFTFKILNENKNFKPYLSYTLYVKASYQDSRPIENDGPLVTINYGFGGNYEKSVTTKINNGIVKVVFDTTPPPEMKVNVTETKEQIVKVYQYFENATISIELEYRGFKFPIPSLTQETNLNGCYMQLVPQDTSKDSYAINETVELLMESNIPVSRFVYQVISRKGVILSKFVESSSSKRHNINVTVQYEMTPKSRVVAYYNCNYSVVADAFEFNVDGLFRSVINTTTKNKDTKPGNNVTLQFNTKIPSFVLVLGIDLRMILLKSGNDIDIKSATESIEKSIGCYGKGEFESCSHRGDQFSEPNLDFAFRMSGLILMTNLIKNRVQKKHHQSDDYAEDEGIAVYSTSLAASMPRRPTLSESGKIVGGRKFKRNKMRSAGESKQYQGEAESETVRVRSRFPDTWIWTDLETDANGTGSTTHTVPDTITSWIVSSISLNNVTGLGLNDDKCRIKVFRHFFIMLHLPYSVIRGETMLLEATIFNYLTKPLNTEVILSNEKRDFIFVEDNGSNKSVMSKSIIVPPNDGIVVPFSIILKNVGYIDIKINATSEEAGDSIIEKLFVKPEGERQFENTAVLIVLNKEMKTVSRSIEIKFSGKIVDNSERVSIVLAGHVMASATNNINKLIRVPCGCGEQNMINLVPNIVVLDYLTKSKELKKKIKAKLISNMKIGYQQQLTYKHNDGSFSAFGSSDSKGSTWLTAFVVKSFLLAKKYIEIDEKVLTSSVEFLISKQENGVFVEDGIVINKAMQSGTADGKVSLTAYAVIALSVDQEVNKQHSESLQKSLDYLVEQLSNCQDVYEIAIICYALHLNNHSQADDAFEKLYKLSIKNDDFIHWNTNSLKKDNFAAIEITSYALLTFCLRNLTEKALPIVKWLISKQNSFGGFQNTQDTVIGIESLAMFASNITSNKTALKFTFETDMKEKQVVEVDDKNAMAYTEILLESKTKKVSIVATGEGTAVAQVSWEYNLKKVNNSGFNLTAKVENHSNISLELKVCARTVNKTESGMAIMEVSLPSGIVANVESLEKLRKGSVKRVETKNEYTVVVLYFDKIGKEVCSLISANRLFKMKDLKPVPITAYDFYNRQQLTTIFYSI